MAENRGGARKGSGRKKSPPKKYSDQFKKKVLAALKKKEKETGKSIYDLFAELIYSKETQDSVKQGLFKIVSDIMVPTEMEIKTDVPKICLPPVMDAPEENNDKP